MKLSVLLTRGWIRYLMKELDCTIGKLDVLFPTVGQATSTLGTSDSSKRWYRWARGECSPRSATTLIDSAQVLIAEHAEKLAPGSKRILDCPLKQVGEITSKSCRDTISKILMTLPPHQAQQFFLWPLECDPNGVSRVDPSIEQIASLSQNPSMEALAGAIGIYVELNLGRNIWEWFATRELLGTLIDEVASNTWWLAKDAKFLRGSVLYKIF